jgi:cold shock CspA family protein
VDQGTIKDFDEETRRGSLLTDDRKEIAIDERSVGPAELRTLRIGQRVKFVTEERDGTVVARSLRLVTWE